MTYYYKGMNLSIYHYCGIRIYSSHMLEPEHPYYGSFQYNKMYLRRVL